MLVGDLFWAQSVLIALLWVCALQPPAWLLLLFILKKNRPLSFFNHNYRLEAENITNSTCLLVLAFGLLYFARWERVDGLVFVPLCLISFQLCVFDLRYLWLPDRLTFPLIALGAVYPFVQGIAVKPHLYGALAALVMFLLPRLIFNRFKGKETLGLGDVKLAAAMGLWLGMPAFPHAIVLACALLFVYYGFVRLSKSRRMEKFPFGVFLAYSFCVFV